MVSYTEWVKAVHTAYKRQGGTYQEGTSAEVVEIAAQFWKQNKEELLDLAFDAAVQLAMRQLNV